MRSLAFDRANKYQRELDKASKRETEGATFKANLREAREQRQSNERIQMASINASKPKKVGFGEKLLGGALSVGAGFVSGPGGGVVANGLLKSLGLG